jgi:hypothetical protein
MEDGGKAMITKGMPETLNVPRTVTDGTVTERWGSSIWQIVAIVSLAAGIGSGWRVLLLRSEFLAPVPTGDLLSPLTATVTMVLATFAGWYVWGYFTHLFDSVLFGGHSAYRDTLNAFGRAYVFQFLFLFTFTRPLGWLWGWIAMYATVAAWGIIGPRQLGMRTWQAIVSATCGMLVWMACLLLLNITLMLDGGYLGIGAFLA